MEQIINYRDIPTDKRLDILNALERIGFFPAYGGVKTMQQIMEKSVPGSGPQFYFVFRAFASSYISTGILTPQFSYIHFASFA